MRRGEIWNAHLPEPWGSRPVLLIARDEAYQLLRWVIVAPITTRLRVLPTVVFLDPQADGVGQSCAIYLDQILLAHRDWLRRRVTRLRAAKMAEVEDAIHFALALKD